MNIFNLKGPCLESCNMESPKCPADYEPYVPELLNTKCILSAGTSGQVIRYGCSRICRRRTKVTRHAIIIHAQYGLSCWRFLAFCNCSYHCLIISPSIVPYNYSQFHLRNTFMYLNFSMIFRILNYIIFIQCEFE